MPAESCSPVSVWTMPPGIHLPGKTSYFSRVNKNTIEVDRTESCTVGPRHIPRRKLHTLPALPAKLCPRLRFLLQPRLDALRRRDVRSDAGRDARSPRVSEHVRMAA